MTIQSGNYIDELIKNFYIILYLHELDFTRLDDNGVKKIQIKN